MLSSIIQHYSTPRTIILLTACDQALLRMVGHERSKNWKDPTNETICTCHLDAISSCLYQRLQKSVHALMVQSILRILMSGCGKVKEFHNW